MTLIWYVGQDITDITLQTNISHWLAYGKRMQVIQISQSLMFWFPANCTFQSKTRDVEIFQYSTHYSLPKWFWLNSRWGEQQNPRQWPPTRDDQKQQNREHFDTFSLLPKSCCHRRKDAMFSFSLLKVIFLFFVAYRPKPQSWLRCPFLAWRWARCVCLFRQDLGWED